VFARTFRLPLCVVLALALAAMAVGGCKSKGSTSGSGGAGGAAGAGGGDAAAGGAGGGDASGEGGLVHPSGPFPTAACLARANTLVGMMTLDEELAQMMQLERQELTPAQVTQYGIGSVYSQGGSAPANNTPAGWADMIDAFTQAALQSRLGIPIIYGIDAVHGAGPVKGATVFPHNIGLGASRDPDLVRQIGRLTAAESLGTGLDFLFSPVIAVARDERWGRTYEAFGETTDLASTMGTALIEGLQFTDTGAPTGLVASAKHYLGDGGTAMGKTGADTAGDEATLRAIHLEPYRAAVAAHAGTVMLSYSSWQGTKMHINKAMITDVLKGELGFGGFVASDFNGCYQVGLASMRDGLGACLNAGVDMFMVYDFTATAPLILTSTLSNLRSLVQDGTVPQARIDDAARRIVAVKCEMGLFEAPGLVDRTLTADVGSDAHRAVARQAVRESLVVLQNNNGVLPLAKTATVALAGNSADNSGNQCGGWTVTWQGLTGNTVPGTTTVRTAMAAVVGADHVVYSADGSTTQGATVGVAVIGELPYAEGMGDRTDLPIPAAQIAAVQALKTAGLPVVVVLMTGRPKFLDQILPLADAVVEAWLPGTEGAGVTDVLFGDYRPTGKLPHSWPRNLAQIPINEGDVPYDPLFAYGFGLTY
jgi:beta-glucosidase